MNITHILDFLAIPSISTDSAHDKDCHKAAEWLMEYMKSHGIAAQLLDKPTKPWVYAEVKSSNPNAQTLLFYGHYDVQPIGDPEKWQSPPFQPEVRDGKIFGRGATDDKGQVMAFVDGLIAAVESGKELQFNVKVLIEGEEEVGSPTLAENIQEYRELLQADVAFICDTEMQVGQPEIVVGLRGLVGFSLKLENAKTDLHSGSYGGGVRNPVNALVQLLNALFDETGTVQLPGFYDDVREFTTEEKAVIDNSNPEHSQITQVTGAQAFISNPQYSIQQQTTIRPTFEIHAIHAGPGGDDFSTVIPQSAIAKVSLRIVPNQIPEKVWQLIEKQVATLIPGEMKYQLTHEGSYWPVLVDTQNPVFQTVSATAKDVWGKEPILNYTGGSIGVVAEMKKILGLDTILLGLGLMNGNPHGANENFPLEQYEKGKEFVSRFLTKA
jgi:acetylornithine deacetylase/succinyl-diaminopimelate desuccinylase-like protein